ncbi:uncharacterized protein LOC141687246 [Apium graveolens]|uniref:uncharacterized protein LOC141687246 n=1 Tax=Apium graveolens TaxID=4045 RepID=UPI003D7BB68F
MTIQESWRGRRSRLKKAHYSRYDNDQDRLENRLDDVPLETFKALLEYWGDETVQERARKNVESRRQVVDTHTAGPRSFSQVKHKMDKIKKNLNTSRKGVDKLITDGKSHDSSWLVGRAVNPSNIYAAGPIETYVQDRTRKIRESLVEEVEVKVNEKVQTEVDTQVNRKVQENLIYVLQKLGEADPNIKIDLGELCATISSDNDNGTPMIGGASS